jgi:hypothetical protein
MHSFQSASLEQMEVVCLLREAACPANGGHSKLNKGMAGNSTVAVGCVRGEKQVNMGGKGSFAGHMQDTGTFRRNQTSCILVHIAH